MWHSQLSFFSFFFDDVAIVVVIIVVADSRNLPLKFGQNRVSYIGDIDDIEFQVVVGGGWWCKVSFMSNPTFLC